MSVAMHVGMFAFSSIGEITMCTVQVMRCKTVAWESTKAEVMQHRLFTGSFREHCSLRFMLFVNRSRLCGKHVLVSESNRTLSQFGIENCVHSKLWWHDLVELCRAKGMEFQGRFGNESQWVLRGELFWRREVIEVIQNYLFFLDQTVSVVCFHLGKQRTISLKR